MLDTALQYSLSENDYKILDLLQKKGGLTAEEISKKLKKQKLERDISNRLSALQRPDRSEDSTGYKVKTEGYIRPARGTDRLEITNRGERVLSDHKADLRAAKRAAGIDIGLKSLLIPVTVALLTSIAIEILKALLIPTLLS